MKNYKISYRNLLYISLLFFIGSIALIYSFIQTSLVDNFSPKAYATETECRDFADNSLYDCSDEKEEANIVNCQSSCEDTILEDDLEYYIDSLGSDVEDLCESYCEYGGDDAYDCGSYAASYDTGDEESYSFARCYNGCIDENDDENDDNCYDACSYDDEVSCVTAADNTELEHENGFCSYLEAYEPEDFTFCEDLEDFDGEEDAYDFCLANGEFESDEADFCGEDDSEACTSECTNSGGTTDLCSATTGACQYLPEASDSTSPVITFENITWNTFEEINSVIGNTTDSESNIASISYQVGSTLGEWTTCSCLDGACDSLSEDFQCNEIELADGNNTVYFKASDTEGNENGLGEYYETTINYDSSPENNMVLWLDMESSNITDSTEFAFDATNQDGVPPIVDGHINNALDYTGNYHARIPDEMSIYDFNQSNEFTIESWIYSDDYADDVYGIILNKTKDNDSDTLWNMTINPDGELRCEIDTNIGLIVSETEDFVLNDSEWYQVGCVWDGNILTAVVNEEIRHETDITEQNAEITDQSGLLTIGGASSNWDQRAFTGLIDEVKFYNQANSYPYPDETPPTTIINDSYPDLSYVVDNTPTFTGLIEDDSTIASARYLFTSQYGIPYNSPTTFDDLDWHTFLPDDGIWDESSETFTVTSPNVLADGEQYLYIIAQDARGNESYHNDRGWLYSYAFDSNSVVAAKRYYIEVVDSSAPIIKAHLLLPDPTMDRDPVIQGYIIDDKTDTTSNIASINYQLDNGPIIPIEPLDHNLDSTRESFILQLENLSVGTHLIEISATDIAGNSTTIASTNFTDTFEVIDFEEHESTMVENSEDFVTHVFQDMIYTDGVWGNGYARLKQNLNILSELKFYSNEDEYGHTYGGLSSGFEMEESIDGIGSWFTVNNHKLYYFNRDTEVATDYGIFQNGVIQNLYEFEYNDNNYLLINYSNSSKLLDINNTPENTSDDSIVDYEGFFTANELGGWKNLSRDNRSTNLGFYFIAYTADSYNLEYLDMNGTPMILSDDTIISWGTTDGLEAETNYTTFYFDSNTNSTFAFSYTYGLHTCNDAGTPLNKSDDSCYSSPWAEGGVPRKAFTTAYDSEANGLWVGGNYGLDFLDFNATADTSDDTWLHIIDRDDINHEKIEHIKLQHSHYPVGQEILFTTRDNSIRGIEINFTPEDSYDDTLYEYHIEEIEGLNVNAGGIGFIMPNENEIWMNLPRVGLYKYNLSRSFASSNIIESLPNPPSGMLEVNNVTLSDVIGSLGVVTPLSLNAKNDDFSLQSTSYSGVDFYVSNDGGLTWTLINEDETVNFDSNDYLIKFKAVLHNLGGTSPVLDSLNMGYATYNTPEDEDRTLTVENSSNKNVGDMVTVTVSIKDKLGFVDNSNNTVTLSLHPSTNIDLISNCITLPSTVNLIDGVTTFQAPAVCSGAFLVKAIDINNPNNIAYGNVITINSIEDYITPKIDLEISPDSENLCGNGILDDGEECDGSVGDLTCQNYKEYNTGILNCTNICTLDTTQCVFVNEITPESQKDDELAKEIDKIILGNKSKPSTFTAAVLITFLTLELIALSTSTKLGGLLLGAPNFIIFEFPTLILRGLLLLGNLFGLRRKGDNIGYIYDATTKEPLSLSIVRIFNEAGKLIRTEVTNTFGVFTAELAKGKYRITASKAHYAFPSNIVKGDSDMPIKNVYHGELKLMNNEKVRNISIPMDSTTNKISNTKAIFKERVQSLLTIIGYLLTIIGFIFSVYAAITTPSWINNIIVIGYLIIFTLTIWNTIYKKRLGIVQYFGNKISGATVLLMKGNTNIALDKRISKEDGTYKFVIVPGKYSLVSEYNGKRGIIKDIQNKANKAVKLSEDISLKDTV